MSSSNERTSLLGTEPESSEVRWVPIMRNSPPPVVAIHRLPSRSRCSAHGAAQIALRANLEYCLPGECADPQSAVRIRMKRCDDVTAELRHIAPALLGVSATACTGMRPTMNSGSRYRCNARTTAALAASDPRKDLYGTRRRAFARVMAGGECIARSIDLHEMRFKLRDAFRDLPLGLSTRSVCRFALDRNLACAS
jgi:hypothetical protein